MLPLIFLDINCVKAEFVFCLIFIFTELVSPCVCNS
uniref:Uncharacterized protein n=1 Tax=Anguilla anguilla TaxID=7936 RepID=A0A0E9REV1_ANGAN